MKKAILILLIGLFWCNTSFAADPKIYRADANSITMKLAFWFPTKNQKLAAKHCAKYKKFALDIWQGEDKPGEKTTLYCVSEYYSTFKGQEVKWTNYDANSDFVKNKSISSSSGDKIAQAKQVCRDLGFKTNSEKFADCALKVMTMNFQTQQVTNSSGGTTQKIIVKNADSGWDELIRLGDKLRAGSSSSSSSSSGTRCVSTVTSFGQLVTNCR